MPSQVFLKERKEALILGLNEADLRFNIAISKMQAIKDRVDELEVIRTLSLRKEFLLSQIEYYKNNPQILETLTKEFNNIHSDKTNILVYQEVVYGYRSMSNRKNVLEEERNHYVKEIEEMELLIK